MTKALRMAGPHSPISANLLFRVQVVRSRIQGVHNGASALNVFDGALGFTYRGTSLTRNRLLLGPWRFEWPGPT